MVRISIYIDGANFVYGLKSLSPKYSDYHFDFERKIIQLKIAKGEHQRIIFLHYRIINNLNKFKVYLEGLVFESNRAENTLKNQFKKLCRILL